MTARVFEDYSHAYKHVKMERRDGILQVTLHTDGGELAWGFEALSELPYCFADIGNDAANKVVRLLRERGLKEGDAVALLCSNRAEFVEVLDGPLFADPPGKWAGQNERRVG